MDFINEYDIYFYEKDGSYNHRILAADSMKDVLVYIINTNTIDSTLVDKIELRK